MKRNSSGGGHPANIEGRAELDSKRAFLVLRVTFLLSVVDSARQRSGYPHAKVCELATQRELG